MTSDVKGQVHLDRVTGRAAPSGPPCVLAQDRAGPTADGRRSQVHVPVDPVEPAALAVLARTRSDDHLGLRRVPPLRRSTSRMCWWATMEFGRGAPPETGIVLLAADQVDMPLANGATCTAQERSATPPADESPVPATQVPYRRA